jgi:hypothetical protein
MQMKALLGGAGFAALLLLGSVPAQSQYWNYGGCAERLVHAERRLDRAIERWGRHSAAAREARSNLEDMRYRCRHHGRDWRGHDHGWRDHGWHDHHY